MAVVISVILVMFIMLAAVTLPLSADISSSIRWAKSQTSDSWPKAS